MVDKKTAGNKTSPQPDAKPAPDEGRERPEKDPATDRLYDSPMPLGTGVPYDPELYEPRLTPEELEELRDEDDD